MDDNRQIGSDIRGKETEGLVERLPSQSDELDSDANSDDLESQSEESMDLDAADAGDLDETIRNLKSEIFSAPVGTPGRIDLLKAMQGMLLVRYDESSDAQDLDDSVSAAREALRSVPEDDQEQRAECLDLLASVLGIRCLVKCKPDDVEEAITLAKQILDQVARTGGAQMRATWLAYLGTRYKERYENDCDIKDLDRAIDAMTEAIEIGPDEDTDVLALELDLGSLLAIRYDRAGEPDNLEEAIRRTRHALAAMGDDQPIRATALSNLANQLGASYERSGKGGLLDEAILRATQAHEIEDQDAEDKLAGLDALANWLAVRYDRAGSTQDLNRSIQYAEEVLQLTDKSSNPAWPAYANNLAATLVGQYIDTGKLASLDKAVTLLEQALEISADNGGGHRAACEITLSQALAHLYQRTGNLPEIESAVALSKSAAEHPGLDPLDHAIYLNTWGDNLEVLFDRTGDLAHIKAAVAAEERAASLFSGTHREYPRSLRSLSDKLWCLYGRTRDVTDLERAVKTASEALEALPEGHPERCDYLASLANLFEGVSELYDPESTEPGAAIASLDEGINLGQKALDSAPKNSPSYGLFLFDQGRRLEKRHRNHNHDHSTMPEPQQPGVGGPVFDLQAAIDCFRLASSQVGSLPLVRIRAGRAAARLLCSLKRWDDAVSIVNGLIDLLPLVCGRYATRTDQQHAASQTSGLASDACSLALKAGGDSNAPIEALQKLEYGRGLILNYAIESRTTIDRELEALRSQDPQLASLFESLQFQAAAISTSISARFDQGVDHYSAAREHAVLRRIHAAHELRGVVDTIRRLPGFDRFLKEPTIQEILSQVATEKQGPVVAAEQQSTVVVVNVTEIGSDALLIGRDGRVHHIPLPDIKPERAPRPFHWQLQRRRGDDDAMFHSMASISYSRIIEKPRDMASETSRSWWSGSALGWLWTTCVGPILNGMQKQGLLLLPGEEGAPARVWWSGSGLATSFPFHAAAAEHPFHGQYQAQDTLHRVVSSYCPTVRALQYLRSRAHLKSPCGSTRSVLVVTMPSTPGHRPLPGADREGEEVKRVFQLHVPSTYSLRWLRCPTAAAVMGSLHELDILHFAGHCSSDPVDPSLSCLILQRPASPRPDDDDNGGDTSTGDTDKDNYRPMVADRLTVSRISAEWVGNSMKGRGPWLAFLSACSTAEVTASELADEGLHLASAFQLAGFPHVIGSLWPVDDDVCVDIARRFYRALLFEGGNVPVTETGLDYSLDGHQVANALREAVVGVRKEHPDRPELWAPFVHFGA